jgi:hypothetical protein
MQREHPDESNDNMKHEHADEQGPKVTLTMITLTK